MQAGGQRAGRQSRQYEYEDVEAIRDEVPIVRAVSAEIGHAISVSRSARAWFPSDSRRGIPYGQMRKLDLADGRYFKESDFADHRRV